MRKILFAASCTALFAIPSPTLAAPASAPAPLTQQACAPGTPVMVCICTLRPASCYPGSYIIRPR